LRPFLSQILTCAETTQNFVYYAHVLSGIEMAFR